ncbi:MAG: hypothetical protein D6785_11255 [Planctomycetota bacterium]|nr:MAG: hypothetical protein D6785_11255 [Planctomycetota bacterium]
MSAVYKHKTGEFYTAPALGTALAVQYLSHKVGNESFLFLDQRHPQKRADKICLYHYYLKGYRSFIILESGFARKGAG